MREIEVHEPGSWLTCEGVHVRVVEVAIGRGYVEYRCEWWNDGELRSASFDDWRIDPLPDDSSKVRVGYRPPGERGVDR
jgi:hypothetical protein